LSSASSGVKLADLRLLEGHENARYMKAAQFQQLVENLRADGVLTSTPLVYKSVVRSGNHRVAAGLKAGIVEADVIELLGERHGTELRGIPEERLLALQLAHNAINGDDDPNILLAQYSKLSFDAKKYSGLSDEAFGKLKELDVESLGLRGPAYEDMTLTFLPEDATQFVALVKRLEAKSRHTPTLLAAMTDFTSFFDTIIKVKQKLNVYNTAIAVRLMAQLAVERLEQMAEAEEAG
jgi:hypothetical protein